MAAVKPPPSVPVIGERVGGAVVKQVLPQLRVLLRVGVLIGGEVLIKRESVVTQTGILQVQNYADISNIYTINTQILYLLYKYFSWIISRS